MPRGAAGDAGAARSARTAAHGASRGGGVLLAVSARVADARDVAPCLRREHRRVESTLERKGHSPMNERGSRWISDWNPEDERFWESKGKFIARRNLIW